VTVVEAARSVDSLVRANAGEAEGLRRQPDNTVRVLVDAGLMRLGAPVAYGGPGASPNEIIEALGIVAAADGSAGWCAMIASTTASMAAFLDPAWATAIYGDHRTVTGGAFAPSGTAVRVDGGHRVTGRWQWGSGSHHCAWLSGGCLTDAGEFHLMFAPADQVEIIDTWDSSGLRGTGSNDLAMDNVFVPNGCSVQPLASRSTVDDPISRFPNFSLLGTAVASVALGIARRAVDEALDLAGRRTALMQRKPAADSALNQVALARAEAQLGAATAYLHDAVGTAWQLVLTGDPVGLDQRARIRLAAVFAGEAAAAATDLAYDSGGGTAVYSTSPLQRCFRDIHTANHHVMISARMYETVGKVLLGRPADTTML
jgi:indole-3-acetate monooxygenase